MTDYKHYKQQLELLLAMTPEERMVLYGEQSVASEQAWLNELLEGWRDDRSFTMEEIRTQRRRVQVWLRRLNEAKLKQKQSEQNATPSK